MKLHWIIFLMQCPLEYLWEDDYYHKKQARDNVVDEQTYFYELLSMHSYQVSFNSIYDTTYGVIN